VCARGALVDFSLVGSPENADLELNARISEYRAFECQLPLVDPPLLGDQPYRKTSEKEQR